ncbi:titin homolog [Mya arenaria]|uniref:titin homolog n=1 Tax=Mya arenaria TaxID=6604 RepID=UPI0022DF010E|nr:titin homolog [Mya arenaria]XP_052780086.1 titin homolog [Mya arenaria]
MRTIKDPKKKPEIRRRGEAVPNTRAEAVLNTVPVEEDQATKCTPPKKRKTTKSQKDDSFNESGSVVDNQSDIVSERSSVIGDDDISDISSYKGTPPKKRNYNRIVEKSPETNIELNNDVHISPAETIKIKDSLKLSLEMKSPQDKKTTPEKKTKPRKKNKSGDSVLSDIHSSTPNDITQKKSPKSKKPVKQKTDSSEPIRNGEISITEKKKPGPRRKVKSDDIEESVPKKTTGRKRKLSGPQGEPNDKTETNAVKESGKKTTPTKRSKKPVSKTIDNAKKEEEKLVENCKTKPKRVRPKKATAKQVNKELEEIAESKKKEETSRLVTKDEEKDEIAEKPSDEPNDNITGIKESVKSNHRMLDLETDNEQSDVGSELETSFESVNSHRTDGDSVRNKPVDNDDENDEEDEEDHDENDEKMGDEKYVEQKIKCEHCGYVSRSKGGHTRHLRKCKPEDLGLEPDTSARPKIHTCEQCEYCAPKRVLVINHMRIHGIFQCKRCKHRADSEDTLNEHSATEHKDRSDCKFCKMCNRYVKCSDVPLEKHMEECQGRIPFKCPECSKEFQYESSLKCHVVSHYPDQPKLFSCNQCDYKSNYKANLKKHIRHIHEQRGERNIKCTECDKLFFSEDNMKRHLKLHSEERPYKCQQEECDKAFKTVNGLKTHEVSHQTDRPFPCEVEGCEKSFKTKRNLISHLNETHQNAPKNYKCEEDGCTMAFYKKCHLERHTDAHKDNRTHFCTYITCTKAFRTAEALKVHALFHTDEKPLKCNHCDYTCRQKSSIRFHMKKKHPELVPPADLKPPKTAKSSEKRASAKTDLDQDLKIDPDATIKAEVNEIVTENRENHSPVNSEKPTGKNGESHEQTDMSEYAIKDKERLVQNSLTLPLPLNEDFEHPIAISTPIKNDENVPFSSKQTNKSKSASQKTSGTDPSNEMNEGVSTSANEKSPKKASANEVSLDRAVLSELPPRKAKKTDMYEFQSEEESGDEMKPGLLRKGYDKDKPPLPRIDTNLLPDIELPQAEGKPKKEVVEKPKKERKKPGPKPKPKVEKPEKPEKEVKEPEVSDAKKPRKRGRKRKSEIEPEADKTEEANEDEKKEKGVDEEVEEEEEVQKETGKKAEKKKTGKRGRSPKGKRGKSPKNIKVDDDDDDDDDDEEEGMPVKKKRGRKPKKDNSGNTGDKQEKVPKKRGRKSKAEKQALLEKDIEPENGDATINYSEVESSELFGDSKDSIADQFRTGNVSDSNTNVVKEFTVELSEKQNESEELKSENDESGLSKAKILDKSDEKRTSSSESSDIGSDFDEDLKPPPAPRPPPMYDSEDGDIESGPENEDFNISAMSNERVRDFESSREISREISRDFESSREIDDSVKTVSDHVHSVDTSTPKEHIHSVGTPASVNPYRNDSVNNELEHIHSVGTPASVNPYRNDSVNNEHEHIHSVGTPASVNPYRNDSVNNEYDNPLSHPDNPLSHPDNPLSHQDNPLSHQSHHSSVPHTPSHVSVPTTPATHEYQESRSIEPRSIEPRQTTDRIIKNPVQGQTNDENTDESSMPEVDKDYVGRFFEEIQCNSVPEITRMNSVEESKTPGKIVENPQSDSGVPSSLNSNQTDSSLQMQSPPADLSIKRMEMMSPERVPPDYVPRSESAHNRSSDRIQGVPSYDSQFTSQNPLEPYNPPLVAPTRETILRQPESNKPPSPSNPATNFMRFAETQRLPTPYDRNLQNLHRIAEGPLPQHNSSSPLLRPVPGRDDVFPGATGVAGSMARNPFHSSWAGQDVRPAHWAHPTYLQQQPGSTSSSLFGKDTYLPGREFMFDPSRAAERNMFTGLAAPPSHTQRPEIPHDTFQFDRFDLGSYFPPSLPVDYTRSAHSTSQKTLDERYRQTGSSVSDYRTLPPTSTGSDMFGVNSSFNLEKFYSSDKFYSRDPMYHTQHISDNAANPFLPGMPSQHSMFGREYAAAHRGFYPQNPGYPFMNMNDKNYSAAAASSKLAAHSTNPVSQQRDLMSVPRPNVGSAESQLQDPYRHHSSMLYNMMNKYF